VPKVPLDAHEWISFEDDHTETTWVIDVTFLESNWTCIFGNGCQGVLTGPAEELVQGCCSYGAHFVDEADRRRVERAAKRLTPDQWQFHRQGQKGTTKLDRSGEPVTRLVKDACIFLNRPDFHRGPGCALHVMALDNSESFLPLKPEVCWQLPLRKEETVDDEGHHTVTIRQWDRRHWGAGGEEFHWWCTESPDAFVGKSRVVDSLHEELVALVGREVYAKIKAHLDRRSKQPSSTRLPHPAVRRRR
jgi:hypothetical protein